MPDNIKCILAPIYPVGDPYRFVWFAVNIFSQPVLVLLMMKAFCFLLTQSIVVSVPFSRYNEKWLGVKLASLLLVL